MKFTLCLFTVFCVSFTALSSHASFITYNNETSFRTASGLVDFQSFEALVPSNTGTDFLAEVNTPEFKISTTQQFLQVWGNPPVSFAPDGNQVVFWYALTQGSVTFDSFGEGIYSFGLTITDWANYVDPGTNAELIFSNNIGDSHVIASTAVGLGDYNDIFFGVVSDTPFSSVTLNTTNNDGWVFFDKVYTGAPVPEPTTILLFGLGLLGISGLKRQKE